MSRNMVDPLLNIDVELPKDNPEKVKITQLITDLFCEGGIIMGRMKIMAMWALFICSQNQQASEEFAENVGYLLLGPTKRNDNKFLDFIKSVKDIEREVKHDIKTLEYVICNWLEQNDMSMYKPFVHMGCTSEDVSDTYYKIACNFITEVFTTSAGGKFPKLDVKWGGSIGSHHSLSVAYPRVDWDEACNVFAEMMGCRRAPITTQVNPNDDFVHWCQVWRSYALAYDGMEVAYWDEFIDKMSKSRYQRDLSTSTLMRNVGIALAKTIANLPHNDIVYKLPPHKNFDNIPPAMLHIYGHETYKEWEGGMKD